MEILEYTGVKSLGITAEACRRYQVPQVKTPTGIKLAAVFSKDCYKILSLSGTYNWVNSQGYNLGEFDPNLGLFGQHAVEPTGKPVIIVPTELEALKLASLGYPAVCLAEPKMSDTLTYSILEENFIGISKILWVWSESTFNKRKRSLENFLLYLAGTGRFTLETIPGSSTSILNTTDKAIKEILSKDVKPTPWKPAGIVFTEDLLSSLDKLEPVVGIPTGIPCIDTAIGGARYGEVTCVTAGSGVGKSTLLQEIAYHIGVVEDQKCGMIFLEEKPLRTALRLAAIKYSVRVDLLRKDPTLLTEKQWNEIKLPRNPINRNFVFHNHFGSLDSDELFSKIDYMIDHCGVKFIFLDHISIAISGMSSKEGERKDIDILMTRLTTRAVSKDVGFWIISHLSVPEGAPHEEGGRVTLSQLRGSGSIKQLSFNILAQERNQQNPDSTHALLRSLKCRETGVTGPIGVLHYDTKTGRLQEDKSWNPLEFEELMSPKKRYGGKSQQQQNQHQQPKGGSSFGKTKFVDQY